MVREWKPGDVARMDGRPRPMTIFCYRDLDTGDLEWMSPNEGGAYPGPLYPARPLVVIDPEDREQVERLAIGYERDDNPGGMAIDAMQAALREFANPTPPTEPTDPKARVGDRRDNVWRLLAAGDWICVDGPDIGEYLAWSLLVERGPLSIGDGA